MMNKKDIFNRFSGALTPKRVSFDKRITHPVREWMIGLILFLGVIIVGGTQSALMFVTYRNISTDEGTYAEPIARYNALLVENVIKKYAERKSAYGALRGTVIPVYVVPEVTEAESEAATTTGTTTEDVNTGEVMMAN